jgi:hypothetical protein
MWNKTRVEELNVETDGVKSKAALRVADGTLVRPIQLVIPFEIDQGEGDVEGH